MSGSLRPLLSLSIGGGVVLSNEIENEKLWGLTSMSVSKEVIHWTSSEFESVRNYKQEPHIIHDQSFGIVATHQ